MGNEDGSRDRTNPEAEVPGTPEGTPADTAGKGAKTPKDDFIVGAQWAGTTLELYLVGVLDAESAPILLDFYEHQAMLLQPRDLEVDASRLRVVTADGVAPLATIAERLGQGHVTIDGATDTLKKALAEAGVSDLFTLGS